MCDGSTPNEPVEGHLQMRDAEPFSAEHREELFKHIHNVLQRSEQAKKIRPEQLQALDRLVQVAEGCTGQSALVANFLLAWLSAPEYGGFDFTDIWGLDFELCEDAVAVFEMIAYAHKRPAALGYAETFEKIVRKWRNRP